MALDFTELHIPLAVGVGQKEDPRALEAPKLTTGENAAFDETGGIQKRTGFDIIEPGASVSLGGSSDAGIGGSGAGGSFLTVDGGTIATDRLRGLASRDKELLMFAQGQCYALAAKEGTWSARGRHEGVLIDEEPTLFEQTSQIRGDRAETGNVIVYAWMDIGSTKLRWEAIDKATGSVFNHATATSVSAAEHPVVRAVNGKILIFYRDSGSLKAIVIDPDDVYTSINSASVVITSNMHTDGIYDVCDFGNFCCVAVKNADSPATYDLYKVTNAGAVSASNTGIRSCELGIAVAYDSTNDVFSVARVAFGVQAGTDYAVYHDWMTATTLADKQVDDVVEAFAAVTTRERLNNLTTIVLPDGNGEIAYVLYDVRDDYGATTGDYGETNDYVRRAIVATAGSVTLDNMTCGGTYVGSRLVRYTDGTVLRAMSYILYSPKGAIEPTYFLMDVEFHVGDTGDTVLEAAGFGIMARVLFRQATDNANLASGPLPQIDSLGSNKFAALLGSRRRLPQGKSVTIFAGEGLTDVTAELFNVRAYQGVEQGKTLYLPGGYLAQYDGTKIIESGFLLNPNAQLDDSGVGSANTLFTVSGAGSLPAGIYSYRFYWERINAKGERQRSTYLGAKLVTVGASKQVDISFPLLPFTLDSNVSLVIYRSAVGPGSDAPHYRITNPDPSVTSGDNRYIPASPNGGAGGTQSRLTVTDDMLDAVLITKEKDYQNAGALGTVMDYVSPPATKVVAGAQHRMFTGDPADKHLIHHSVERVAGEGVQFQDLLSIAVPHEGGDFVGLAAIDNGLIVFKERAIYIVPGSGPDAYGNQPYAVPHPLELNIGCIDSASIAVTNPGVFFLSHKGPYLIDHGGNVEYIGADVEDEDLSTLVGVVEQPEERRVIFAKNDSTDDDSLVYDYYAKSWSPWTGDGEATKQITAITRFGSRIAYMNSTGVYQNATSTWRDGANGYGLDVETAWIKPADLSGFVKLRRFFILGELRDVCNLRVRVAYDYASAYTDDITHDYASVTAGDPLRLRQAFSKRRVQAFKIRITETASTTGGDSSWKESVKLTGIGVEVGRKKGVFKLPSTVSQ